MPNTTTVAIMVSFLLSPPPRAKEGWNEKTLETTFRNNKNTMTYCFYFPGLKNQGDVDETGTQLSLATVIVLFVASLVAVAMICGTIVQ